MSEEQARSRSEFAAYERRWRNARAMEREELRAASLDEKLRQLTVMMEAALTLGWEKSLGRDDAAMMERFRELREAYRGA